jgi:transposase
VVCLGNTLTFVVADGIPAGMNNPAAPLPLSHADRDVLTKWARSESAPYRVVTRAKVLLMAGDGVANSHIATTLGISRPTVLNWRARFLSDGLDSVGKVRPGRGRKPGITAHKVQAIVEATLHEKPPGATQWSCRSMAKAGGVSPATVQRIWDAHGLQPHRVKTFKLSTDPAFVEKLTDVVGLYLNPPEKAVVLCVDEKSQIQALDRTQPGLPMKPGRRGTMTHDYKRHGTTTLFAALNVLTGKVIGQCHGRHRHQEFLKFLRRLDRAFPPDLTLHIILDNYGTHKHEAVRKWLAAHPRFKLHFTPTSSSWLNLVESWFSKLTQQRLRRGVFCSVQELVAAIKDYLTHHNANPKPFVWSTTVETILGKIRKCKAIIETYH